MLTLTGVEISSDHHYAKVFFTTLGGPESVARTISGLEHASGFLRSQLAKGLKLRLVPELRCNRIAPRRRRQAMTILSGPI
jgi:ribosome-binding factor A